MKYYEVDFHIHFTGNINSSEEYNADNDIQIQDIRDLIAAYAGETGFETFEDTDCGLKGYVQTNMFDDKALQQSMEEIPFEGISITYDVNEAEDKDWNEEWEAEGFEPIIVNNTCIIHDGRHIPDNNEFAISVEIDAKLAFGTGTHETTRMIVASMLEMELKGKKILDCGCGTGILGIVALKCGATSATGYDIDDWSVNNSQHNAIINMVDKKYESLLGDSSVLDGIKEKYDIVAANINRNILLADMPIFKRMMNDNARLLISGFYTEDIDTLTDKATSIGLKVESCKNDNNWACIIFKPSIDT